MFCLLLFACTVWFFKVWRSAALHLAEQEVRVGVEEDEYDSRAATERDIEYKEHCLDKGPLV